MPTYGDPPAAQGLSLANPPWDPSSQEVRCRFPPWGRIPATLADDVARTLARQDSTRPGLALQVEAQEAQVRVIQAREVEAGMVVVGK